MIISSKSPTRGVPRTVPSTVTMEEENSDHVTTTTDSSQFSSDENADQADNLIEGK